MNETGNSKIFICIVGNFDIDKLHKQSNKL